MGKKLYRVYLTLYDREEFSRLTEALRKRFSRVKVYESKLVPEFKFLEIHAEEDGLEGSIKEEVYRSVGRRDITIRVDRISI